MRPRPSLTRATVITVALTGSLGFTAAGSSAAFAAPRRAGRVQVTNAQPALGGATAAGTPSSAQRIDVTLYLANRNGAQLDALIKDVSDPERAHYGKYLTAEQFRARFSPTAATLASVKKFVTGAHLTVGAVPANRSYVKASGTVAQVQQAFGTSLRNYRMQGRTVRAAATAPSIPAALQGQVYALSGLASVSSLVTSNHEDGPGTVTGATAARVAAAGSTKAPPPDVFINARPCSAYYGEKLADAFPPAYGTTQPYAPCGYVPKQLQGAYGVAGPIAKGVDGRGVTVAITDAYASPTILNDANTYARRHGQKAFAQGQFSQVLPAAYRFGYDDEVNGDQCDERGWYGEETLDVEAVHGVAPGAKIKYVASPSCDNTDFANTINQVVDFHLADIVSNSWGGVNEDNGPPDELNGVYEQIFEQAAATGIGFYFSSGDSGDGSDPANGVAPTVQAPANSPFVTAVGGTSIGIGKDDQRLGETGWSTARTALNAAGTAWDPAPPGVYQYGGGGGTSRVFAQPAYQRGVVPAALSQRYGTQKARVVPDVSAIGDPNTGFLVGETQTFPDGSAQYSEYRIGGTSLSSPVFAGIMAIADQKAGHPHGFANPALYRAYRSSGTAAFYDSKRLTGVGVVRVDYSNGVNASVGLITSLRTVDYEGPGTILRTRTGYDDMTGIGSPVGPGFLKALSR